jgi:hypothetical protein
LKHRGGQGAGILAAAWQKRKMEPAADDGSGMQLTDGLIPMKWKTKKLNK